MHLEKPYTVYGALTDDRRITCAMMYSKIMRRRTPMISTTKCLGRSKWMRLEGMATGALFDGEAGGSFVWASFSLK